MPMLFMVWTVTIQAQQRGNSGFENGLFFLRREEEFLRGSLLTEAFVR